MTYQEVLKQLKAKKYQPVYFLYGSEPYFIDKISNYIEQNVLDESEKAFNLTIFYGPDTDARTVIDAASRYPVMAERQVILLKEAQGMRTLKNLQHYIENPISSTLLVIAYKQNKFDGRTGFAKALKKNTLVFESKQVYDNQLPDWIGSYLHELKYDIHPEAKMLIAEYLDTNLGKVVNELDKLIINIPKGTLITAAHIKEFIGINKDYDIFELQRAIGLLDPSKVFRIAYYFAANPKTNPFILTIRSLYNYFTRLYIYHGLFRKSNETELMRAMGVPSKFFMQEYKNAAKRWPPTKIENAFRLLHEYDLKSKGIGSSGAAAEELQREMLIKLLV